MSCHDIQEALIEHLYGDLAAPTRREVEAHRAVCADCAATWASLQALHRDLHQWTDVTPPLKDPTVRNHLGKHLHEVGIWLVGNRNKKGLLSDEAPHPQAVKLDEHARLGQGIRSKNVYGHDRRQVLDGALLHNRDIHRGGLYRQPSEEASGDEKRPNHQVNG